MAAPDHQEHCRLDINFARYQGDTRCPLVATIKVYERVESDLIAVDATEGGTRTTIMVRSSGGTARVENRISCGVVSLPAARSPCCHRGNFRRIKIANT